MFFLLNILFASFYLLANKRRQHTHQIPLSSSTGRGSGSWEGSHHWNVRTTAQVLSLIGHAIKIACMPAETAFILQDARVIKNDHGGLRFAAWW